MTGPGDGSAVPNFLLRLLTIPTFPLQHASPKINGACADAAALAVPVWERFGAPFPDVPLPLP